MSASSMSVLTKILKEAIFTRSVMDGHSLYDGFLLIMLRHITSYNVT